MSAADTEPFFYKLGNSLHQGDAHSKETPPGTEDVFSHASSCFSLACYIANCDSAKHPSHLLRMCKTEAFAKTSMDLTGGRQSKMRIVDFKV